MTMSDPIVLPNKKQAIPLRVDYGGPHEAITSDGAPLPEFRQNEPVVAGTLVVVGIDIGMPKEPEAVKRNRQEDESP